MRDERFPAGSSIVRRDVWSGRAFTAWPGRVLEDDGETLTTVLWPGSQGFGPSTWVEWLRSGDRTLREAAIASLANDSWHLAAWTWQSNICVRQVMKGRWYAVTAFFDAENDAFKCWYVDFERPPTRTRFGIDTRDLFLDGVVTPDYSILWKDEDEYDRAIALGLLTADDCANVSTAREEFAGRVAERTLLSGTWMDWRLDRSWTLPTIPSDMRRDLEASCQPQ